MKVQAAKRVGAWACIFSKVARLHVPNDFKKLFLKKLRFFKHGPP